MRVLIEGTVVETGEVVKKETGELAFYRYFLYQPGERSLVEVQVSPEVSNGVNPGDKVMISGRLQVRIWNNVPLSSVRAESVEVI